MVFPSHSVSCERVASCDRRSCTPFNKSPCVGFWTPNVFKTCFAHKSVASSTSGSRLGYICTYMQAAFRCGGELAPLSSSSSRDELASPSPSLLVAAGYTTPTLAVTASGDCGRRNRSPTTGLHEAVLSRHARLLSRILGGSLQMSKANTNTIGALLISNFLGVRCALLRRARPRACLIQILAVQFFALGIVLAQGELGRVPLANTRILTVFLQAGGTSLGTQTSPSFPHFAPSRPRAPELTARLAVPWGSK